jgi:uncharacterized protein YciI
MTSVPRHHIPEAPLTDLSEIELRSRVARAQTYALEMYPIDGSPEPTQEQTRDHLAYLYKLEQSGRLYGAGPVGASRTSPAYELAIVVAASEAQAEEYAANEPLNKAGLVEIKISSHIINEGVACYFARELSKRAQRSNEDFNPDTSTVALSYDDLVSHAQGVNLHLIRLLPGDKTRPKSDTQIGYNHFIWLRGNEMRAQLMSCGPFEIPHAPGIWGGGLAVVATDAGKAEELRAAEPSGQAGYRVLTVEPWVMNFGLAAPIAQALATLNQLT